LFDIESNIALMRTEYHFEDSFDLPGVDLISLYDFGTTFYDWFTSVGKGNNPHRKAMWSRMAFIALEHDWIMHLKTPFYRNRYTGEEKMTGIIGVHLNLDWVTADTIAKSAVRMMLVKDDSTPIGMNGSARRDIQLETFDKSMFHAMNPFDPLTTGKKKRFVYETLNLECDKSDDIASFAVRLKSEFQFRHSLGGRMYTVIREREPVLGLNFVALLEDGERSFS